MSNFTSWTASDVSEQLNSNGFGYAASTFRENEITGDLLPMLTEDHIKEMGITSIGQRLLLLKYIRDVAGVAPARRPPQGRKSPSVEFGEDDVPPPSSSKPAQRRAPPSYDDPPSPAAKKPAAKRAQTAAPTNDESVPKCKRDHDKMVESIRAARRLAAYEKAVEEGKAVGPPPELPPIEEPPGLVSCPHCGRRFGEEAAKHHIPVCERMNAKRTPRGGRR